LSEKYSSRSLEMWFNKQIVATFANIYTNYFYEYGLSVMFIPRVFFYIKQVSFRLNVS
jgi:hypothetical protein